MFYRIGPEKNVGPAYAEKSFANVAMDRLHLIASKTGRDGSISIHQDADLFVGRMKSGGQLKHSLAEGRHAWVQLIEGELDLDGSVLKAGDAAAISQAAGVALSAAQASTFLLFDLN